MARVIEQFTYAYFGSGDVVQDRVDSLRFLVGDVDDTRPLLDDREVKHVASLYPNDFYAAAVLSDNLCAQFSKDADVSVGQVRKSLGSIAEQFCKRAIELRREACKLAIPSFPATKISTKRVLENNPDLTKPQFCIGIFDNHFAVQIKDNLDDLSGYGYSY